MPALTIGMPVYNNARTLERAVRSLQEQTFGDFRLLISDDGSADDTLQVAQRIAAEDARIVVERQPRNLNYGNFRHVLSKASSPYFMFAAGDDWWAPTFVERCIGLLEEDSRRICANSQVLFVPDGADPFPSANTGPLVGTPAENIACVLERFHENSRMYGVFRTEVARRAFPRGNHHAYDVTFSVASLREGLHVEWPEVLMYREFTEPDRYLEYVRNDNHTWISRLFPLLPMTWSLLVEKRIPWTRRIIAALVNVNLSYHTRYVARYHPRLVPVADRMQRWLSFR
jgi:glycosyltransferase involved in cell wall biosynthesis